ncbi:hypothetical protein ANCDUO_05703 [Ancylostoma duodenale]|uniref:Uncharacterized protein n=1 Tax=Ancylostoma duodenale TaxID=51022 RepID=A0A0C2GRS5_9BILA|nr:hypothetical protein ANCDUO_05703 [Ancylostoma duodenale]
MISSDITNMSLSNSSDLLQAMEDLDMPEQSTVISLLRQISSRLERLELDNELLLERTGLTVTRTAPKSNCVFCSVEENKDSHYSSRCCTFADPVFRTVQASKLGLCLKCLKPSHGEDDCKVVCGGCGLGHNQLLCHSKRPYFPNKRPRN